MTRIHDIREALCPTCQGREPECENCPRCLGRGKILDLGGCTHGDDGSVDDGALHPGSGFSVDPVTGRATISVGIN